jgi:hypothetical protein
MSPRARAVTFAGVGAIGLLCALGASGRGLFREQVSPPAALSAPLVVEASLAPNPTFFGDLVVAEVTVDFDAGAVAARSIGIDPDFVPYAATGVARVSSSRAGSEQTDVYRYSLQCVGDGCLPGAQPRKVQFPPVIVSALHDGKRVTASATWPSLFVATRLEKSDLASATPRFRSPATMPPATYAVRPGLLAALLVALGAILALAAFALLGVELLALRARARRRAADALSPLQRAIAYTRQAADRPEATDRRKAIGLLARTLAAEGHDSLADSTNGTAWSDVPPSPLNARTLADEIETALGERQT